MQKKINKKLQKPIKDPRGVVFIQHLPHGFFEEQLKKYFAQFGNVTRVRLARSTRTGNSKGYAFVEFEYPEVAQVAAETMDNYLMFKKVVKASYIPPEKQEFNYFRTTVKQVINKSGKKVWVSAKTASIQNRAKQHNDWSEENYKKRTAKQLKKLKEMGEKFAHLGIDINDLIIPPTVSTTEDSKTQDKSVKSTSSKELKRKSAGEKQSTSTKKENTKKAKKNVTLEDLLGNTIQEDSDDEDYIAMPESGEEVEENAESTDEETYGFTKDSDNEDDEEEYDESDKDEEVPQTPVVVKKAKKTSFGKSLKVSNVDRVDQMLKRKPHTGGVQKSNKKIAKQPSVVSKTKSALQLKSAKEVAKPLPKVKAKTTKSVKPKTVANKAK